MTARRAPEVVLHTAPKPRWLTTRNFSGALLEYHRIEPGTNLVRTLLAAMLDLVDTGWELGEFSSLSASVWHERGRERRRLAIELRDPELSEEGRSWGVRCVGCDE